MKKIIYYILAFTSIIVAASSCISSEETNYMQNLPKDYPLVSFEEYKLSVRDNITCQISTTDEETRELYRAILADTPGQQSGIGLVIYEDSTIILPFFGAVKVAGLTLQQAELKVQDMMQESILDAQVKLSLLNNNFYIYANDRQGAYRVYKENLTIYQALAISGQTSDNMDLSKVTIVRKGEDGKDIRKIFDLRSQDVIQSEFYYIKPNDVIYFPTNKNSFFSVTSVSSFINMVMTPLTFLFFVSTYKF